MTLSMEEVERRLRCVGATYPEQIKLADALKAHRERCVDAEALESKIHEWRKWCCELNAKDPFCNGEAYAVRAFCEELTKLLPLQKSALQRAIEMVEADCTDSDQFRTPLLALLREAKKEE